MAARRPGIRYACLYAFLSDMALQDALKKDRGYPPAAPGARPLLSEFFYSEVRIMSEKAPSEKVDELKQEMAPEAEDAGQGAKGAPPSEAAVEALIRKRVYAAVAIGFVPLPLVDFLGLSALQLEMIYSLAGLYKVEFEKERVKSIISSLCGGALTTASVPLAASLFKSIPVIGTTAGAATISIMGAASTYALGCVFDWHFRNGGSIFDFNARESGAYFKSKMEEGKAMAGRLKEAVKN